MAIHTLDIPVRCPGTDHVRSRCVECLRERLMRSRGLRQVEIDLHPDEQRATLRLDYDAKLLPLSHLEAQVRHAGLCLADHRAEVVIGLDGMVSPRSEQQVEAALAKLPGVIASASYVSRSLRVEFDRRQCAMTEIARRLDELGFRLRPLTPAERRRLMSESHLPHDQAAIGSPAEAPRWWQWASPYHKLAMAVIGGLLLLGAVINNWLDGPAAVRAVLLIGSYVIAGWFTAIDTFHVLRRFKFDIDVLMFAAAFGAALLGHYEEGAFLLVLFALGGAGEELAMDRARRAIEALAKLAPETALRREADGSERLVRVEELAIGNEIIIKPFERVPADATVVRGESAVDQSPITGESVPVPKAPGASIFAGTINTDGLLVATVTRLASDSTLARIVRLVNEAQTTKSPTQVFTDAVERRYVPFVLVATTALIVIPPLIWGEWGTWFYRAMAFLTAASPCALAIGTPAAVLSGIAKAARIGVLIKGGVHLENLGRVKVVAFDKTGTLTRGRPIVTDIHCADGLDEAQVLSLAAAVERSSSHPLAAAIVHEAERRGLAPLEAEEATQEPGIGVRGRVGGRVVVAGHVEHVLDGQATLRSAVETFAAQGKSSVGVSVDGRGVAVIALADRPRDNAAATISRLKRIGIKRVIMLTGDRSEVAKDIGRQLGVDEIHAQLLPEQKLDIVRSLRERYGLIAMIGDGVNDAPALATADVGIAMGGAGTDVALETADVALMGDDLARLPSAIGLSRFSRRIIAQNLVIALGTIAVLAPLAALGYAMLGVAVLFHEGSTVVVVLNSLRLLLYREQAADERG